MIGKLFYGTVADNADPDQKGKVQVRLLPELQDARADTLPWVRPFTGAANTTNTQAFDPPAKESPVWVVFTDEYFQQGYWLSGPPAEDDFNFTSIQQTLAPLNLSGLKPEETTFRRFADGTITFSNGKTKEFGTMHSTGSWSIIRANGSIEFSGKDQNSALVMLSTGEITYKSSVGHRFTGKDMKFEGDYLVSHAKLKTILENVITSMSNLMMTDPLSGVSGPAMPATLMNALFPTTSLDLTTMKTEKL